MRLIFFMLIYLGFTRCFAETNRMEYFYKYRCENARPDFAALAVLEKQSCPQGSDSSWWFQTCTSRYRIISVLDAVSDTLRKEYLEAENYPIMSWFLHRPILIFGSYKNSKIQIEEYEETRGYFFPFNISIAIQNQEYGSFYPLVASLSDIYALHSVGTPYHTKDLDTRDSIFYNKYLIPRVKQYVKYAGKDFNELWRRLAQKRTPVKTSKIKNGFAALGTIRSIHTVRGAKRTQIYELSLAVETVFKNDANIDSSIRIYIDRERLPPVWGCLHSESLYKIPFYLFGDIKDGNLIIESWGFTRDMFVFGDTIYDMAMGLPFKELFTYFLPSNISFEEFEFGNDLRHSLNFPLIKNGERSNDMILMPECRRKAIIEIAEKWVDFFDNERTNICFPLYSILDTLYRRPSKAPVVSKFRCRKDIYQHAAPFSIDFSYSRVSKKKLKAQRLDDEPKKTIEKTCNKCSEFVYGRLGQWGRKLPYMQLIE